MKGFISINLVISLLIIYNIILFKSFLVLNLVKINTHQLNTFLNKKNELLVRKNYKTFNTHKNQLYSLYVLNSPSQEIILGME